MAPALKRAEILNWGMTRNGFSGVRSSSHGSLLQSSKTRWVWDSFQISLLILKKFKPINFFFP